MEPIIRFENVTFFYPKADLAVTDDNRVAEIVDPSEITQVFRDLTIDVPPGVTSLVGQNGTGKTTFLLLAGARVFPAMGRVVIENTESGVFRSAAIDPVVEEERNKLVSFVYQNMEFETAEPIGGLMEHVFAGGSRSRSEAGFLKELTTYLELDSCLNKKTQELSKGQLQRAIIAFSLLYGSRIILMDEPVFALEEEQKSRVFSYLVDFAHRTDTSILYSAHNLELTSQFSDYLMLFAKDGSIRIGPTAELFTRDTIEQAYQVPYDLLYRKEHLYREMLNKTTRPSS